MPHTGLVQEIIAFAFAEVGRLRLLKVSSGEFLSVLRTYDFQTGLLCCNTAASLH